jgi:uncharacterized protein YjbI with pentapeptide repeats
MRIIKNIRQARAERMIDEHEKWLRSIQEEGEQADFGYTTCKNIDFSEGWEPRQLNGALFDNAILEDCCFESVNLWGADFSEAIIKNCNFEDANLEDANFKDAILIANNFEDANLKDVNFKEAIFDDEAAYKKRREFLLRTKNSFYRGIQY